MFLIFHTSWRVGKCRVFTGICHGNLNILFITLFFSLMVLILLRSLPECKRFPLIKSDVVLAGIFSISRIGRKHNPFFLQQAGDCFSSRNFMDRFGVLLRRYQIVISPISWKISTSDLTVIIRINYLLSRHFHSNNHNYNS